MKPIYRRDYIKAVEREIVRVYYGHMRNDEQGRSLLVLRKKMLDNWAFRHPYELLPDITDFNNALIHALHELYNKAHDVYAKVSQLEPKAELTARCFLTNKYPELHPYQGHYRDDIWNALREPTWNPLYKDGVSLFELNLPQDIDESFDHFAGIDESSSLGALLHLNLGDKDIAINSAFHNLFSHTNFALTDFIFVREFNIKINIIFEEKVRQPK